MRKYEPGQVYGHLTIISRVVGKGWLCRCSCGNERVVQGDKLGRGDTISCGHVRTEKTVARSTTHGLTARGAERPSVYWTWVGIKQRCNNPNSPAYKNYGGRGITVDPRWHDFLQFHADMGDRPPGLTLERRNNDGPYCKENCYWADRKAQARNNRRTRRITFMGETKCLLDWARHFCISRDTLYKYLGEFGDDAQAMEYLRSKYGGNHVDPAD